MVYQRWLFQKVISQTIYKCKLCEFPLSKFSNFKKKAGYCVSCETKIINSSFYSKQNEYINELKGTCDTPATMTSIKTEEFINSTYFNEVSQYKTLNNNISKTKKTSPKNKSTLLTNNINNISSISSIHLNMSIPDDITNLII